MLIRLFENYPFKNTGMTVAEGFLAYSGNLRTVPGMPHGGIDYVLKKGDEFASFEIFSMYEGSVKFGVSDKYGKFFSISKIEGDFLYETVYAHIDNIPDDILKYAIIQGDKDFIIPAAYPLGWAARDSKNIRHLHVELHQKNLLSGVRRKLDPYGLYEKFLNNNYPQPGESLKNYDHVWVDDDPLFIGD